MRRVAAIAAALALLAAGPATAQEEQPPAPGASPDRITILGVFKTITFGEAAFVSGRFRRQEGPDAEVQPYTGRTLTLEQAPSPFTTFTPIATTVTDREGYYNFKALPGLHTRYRVVSQDPPMSSDAKLVRVRARVDALRVSTRTPVRGRSVTFSGSVSPAHPGARVEIQKRDRSSRWRTVGSTRLRQATGNASSYELRMRVRTDGVFRARMPGDGDHLAGVGASSVELTVRKPKKPRRRSSRR